MTETRGLQRASSTIDLASNISKIENISFAYAETTGKTFDEVTILVCHAALVPIYRSHLGGTGYFLTTSTRDRVIKAVFNASNLSKVISLITKLVMNGVVANARSVTPSPKKEV